MKQGREGRLAPGNIICFDMCVAIFPAGKKGCCCCGAALVETLLCLFDTANDLQIEGEKE